MNRCFCVTVLYYVLKAAHCLKNKMMMNKTFFDLNLYIECVLPTGFVFSPVESHLFVWRNYFDPMSKVMFSLNMGKLIAETSSFCIKIFCHNLV